MNIWKQLNNKHEWTSVQHQRVKDRLLSHIRISKAMESSSKIGFAWARVGLVSVLAVLVVLVGGGGVTVAAAKDSAPHESLYPVRIFSESMMVKLTPGNRKKSYRALGYAKKRLIELRMLAEAQSAADGKGRVEKPLGAQERLDGFRKGGDAMYKFSSFAHQALNNLQAQETDIDVANLAMELDAVLDASIGIMYSAEIAAGAEEPVRVVLANTKKDISALESEAEKMLNKKREYFMQRLAKKPSAPRGLPAAAAPKAVAGGHADDVQVLEFIKPSKEMAEQFDEDIEFMMPIVDHMKRAQEMLDESRDLIDDYEQKFGTTTLQYMRAAQREAGKSLKQVDVLISEESYQQAFEEAFKVLRTGMRIRIYTPITNDRTSVRMEDEVELRLNILPEYEEGFNRENE